jgi:hypothetical protein
MKGKATGKKGFYYEVTDEQIRIHRSRTVEQVFAWLESANNFLNMFQTAEEKERMHKIRKGEY